MSQELKIKQISATEIWNGENRSTLRDGNIIHVIAKGEQTLQSSLQQLEANHIFSASLTGKVSFLIDLNQAGKNSPEARMIWKQTGEHENTFKIAMYGLHPVARVIASFAIGISKNPNQRFFKTEEEALAWIKE